MIYLHEIIDKQNLKNPDAPAFLGRKTISYLKLHQMACQLANLIESKTKRTTRPIGLTFSDDLMEIITTFAMSLAGRRCISLPYAHPPEYKKFLIDYLKINQILTDNISNDLFSALSIRTTWADLEDYSTEYTKKHPTPVEGQFITVTTSGSTGSPKVFELTHSMILERLDQRVQFFSINENERFLRISSNSYIGSKIRVLSILKAGGGVVIRGESNESLFDTCQKFGVSFLSAIVLQVEQLLNLAGTPLTEFGERLRVLELSASHVSDELRARIHKKITRNTYITYSTNETGAISIATPDEILSTSGTVGKTLPNVETKIVDNKGNEIKNEIGLICARTKQMIHSYRDNYHTRRNLQKKFFITGDVGYKTDDGQIIYIGRGDDMMIVNGINLYPAEIEKVFKRHPHIKDVKVKAVQHQIHQHLPICVISLKEGVSSTESDLYRFGLQNLGSKAPRKIVIVGDLPRNDLGKVDHNKIMEIIRENLSNSGTKKNNAARTCLQNIEQSIVVRLNVNFPKLISSSDYDRWVKLLVDNEISQLESVQNVFLAELKEDNLVFMRGFLALSRTLLEKMRVPVFSDIEVTSIKHKDPEKKVFALELNVAEVNFIAPFIYKRAFEVALELCQWMAQNYLTPENRDKVFKTIDQRVVKVLQKFVPGGDSTIPVLKVAHSLGIPFMHLGAGVYQMGWGSKARRLDRSTTELDSSMGAKLAQNKVVTADLLRLAGLPAPIHVVVATEAGALTALERFEFPLVVKPVDRDRGEGVSVDILDSDALKVAFVRAHELSKSKKVIIERQVDGVCHRLFVANGRILYAVKRLPMSIRGDGSRTISQLVSDEVAAQQLKAPWGRSKIQPIDDRARITLAQAGFSSESIPAKGILAPLRRIETTTDGGVDEEVTTIVHPENLSAAIAAAKLFGLHVAGIDIISPDIAKPWHENGAIINEVNFAPLFGGGEISRASIPLFFAEFIEGDGKIPIEIFDTEEAALTRQAAYQKRGMRCYFTTATKTIDFSGGAVMMPFDDIRRRLKALVCRSDVDAITATCSDVLPGN